MDANQLQVIIQAVLNTSGVTADVNKIQQYINQHAVEIIPKINAASTRNDIKSLSNDIAKQLNSSLNLNLKGSDIYRTLANDMTKLASVQQRMTQANTMQKWLDGNTKSAKTFGNTINSAIVKLTSNTELSQAELNKIRIEFQQIQTQARQMGTLGQTFGDKFSNATQKFVSWGLASQAVMSAVINLRKSLSELKDIDTTLTEISKTNETLTKSDLSNIGTDAFSTASKYGKKASDYLLAVQEVSRAGYTNAEDMANLSTLAQSAGAMTADLANQYLIATDAAYKLQGQTEKLNTVLDGQNYITNHNALSMSDLAEATKVAASQADSSGVSIDKMSAAVGTMIASTQQGGDIAGRAFKAILMNIQQVKGTVDEETGDVVDEDQLSKYEKAAENLGVKLKEVKDGYLALRDPMEVLKELSKAYNSLPTDDSRRADLINAIGGKIYHVAQKCATRMILIAGNALIG